MWEGSEEVMRVFLVVLVLFLASSLLLVPIQGFLPSFSKYGSRRQLHPQMSSSLDERELAKIFGRLADKMILLDIPGAGTPGMVNCCHGGCDNCDYSHVFDQMNAGRAKWVPSYTYRQLIDGREHTSTWSKIFENGEEVKREDFTKRLIDLPFQMNMGAVSVPADEAPSRQAALEFFNLLSAGSESLTKNQLEEILPVKVKDKHGVVWSAFKKAFVSAEVNA